MKHLTLRTRLLCLLLCLSAALAMALPVCAKPIPSTLISAAPVYHRPDRNSTVIGYMPENTELHVLGRCGKYYRINCYDMVGFIHEDFVIRRSCEYYVNQSAVHKNTVHFPEQTIGNSIIMQRRLYNYAMAQVGVPYVSGGTSPRGFDCSGFTQYIYHQLGISIPRTCDGQLSSGLIIPKEELQCGDLVLFQHTTAQIGLSTHVGIYLGNGKLIHAGGRGITVVDLNSAYFIEHYLCARRIIVSEKPRFVISSAAAPIRLGVGCPE